MARPSLSNQAWSLGYTKTSLSLKGPLATIPPRRALDLSINKVMVREKLEPSRRKLFNEVRLHMGFTYLSDMCNAAGTHILPEAWNCQRQSHALHSPSWPNVKAPGRQAKAAWQSMLQSLFILPGHSHRQLASPLGEWLAPLDAHWIWWHDPVADTLWENCQLNEWHTWTALPHRYQHHCFSHAGPSVEDPPGNPSHATVQVSGSVAKVQDIGASIPQQSAVAPSTLQEAILALPPTCLWAVQHAQSDNHGLTVAQAIAQGTAVAVSDGSLRYTLGTSAFVIEGATPDHHELGYNRVPGPVEEGDSHRCELAGLCAIVTKVNCLCRLHSVTSGLITIACDNTSALKPTAVDYLPHPRQRTWT